MAIVSVLFEDGRRRDFEVPEYVAVGLVDKFDELSN